MKILAIYFESGSGINVIYERLLNQLTSKGVVVDLVRNTPLSEQENIRGLRNHYHRTFTPKMQSWYRKFLRWFGTTPISDHWSQEVSKCLANDYDVVLACFGSTQLTPLVCGRMVAQKLGCKLAVYMVDAIPAPGGWTSKKSEFRGKLRIVRRLLPAADYVASANKHMLAYQLTTFKHKQGLLTNALYTSSPEEWHTNPISKRTLFLYTGSLYGLRNPNYMWKAFKRIVAERPEAELMLVGLTFRLRGIDKILSPEERKHVIIARHTKDLAPFFADAKVLIDMDADREKDPFLSSKIAAYLRVNRMIVCETGKDTPSRELFADYRTIIQCDHSAESMYEGMKKALIMAESEQDFSERQPLIDLFSASNIGTTLWEDLKRLLS